MHNEVKQAIATGKGADLRYFFVDSWNIDPTFTSYQEDFDYCCKYNIFEKQKELTPFRYNEGSWDRSYWLNLKADLQENFSEERMRHMISVAKVVFKDKINRRQGNTVLEVSKEKSPDMKIEHTPREYRVVYLSDEDDPEKQQERKLQRARKELAEKEEAKRKEEATRRVELEGRSSGGYVPKKSQGMPMLSILVGVAVVIVIIFLLLISK